MWRFELKKKNDVFATSTINEFETIIDLFRFSIRLSKTIQKIQRLFLTIYISKKFERTIRIHNLIQFLFRSTFMINAKRKQWLKMIICIICKIFEKIDNRRFFRNWNRCDLFINYIEFMKNFVARYEFQNVTLLNANAWTTIYFDECEFYEKATNMHK